MGDIRCRQCGEPWDAYGARHGDMTEEEYEAFVRGDGCPNCIQDRTKQTQPRDLTDFARDAIDPANYDGDPIERLDEIFRAESLRIFGDE